MWNEVEISWCLSGVKVPDELQYKMAQRCLHDFTINILHVFSIFDCFCKPILHHAGRQVLDWMLRGFFCCRAEALAMCSKASFALSCSARVVVSSRNLPKQWPTQL